MKTRIKLNDVNYRIKSSFRCDIVGFPFDDKDTMHHNEYYITVTNLKTKKRVGFKFYGSHADWQEGKIELDRQELIFTFYCLLSDGLSGMRYSFDEFCQEFSYDTDSRRAYKIYKACVKSSEKIERIGFDNESVLCDTLNYLSENYDC